MKKMSKNIREMKNDVEVATHGSDHYYIMIVEI